MQIITLSGILIADKNKRLSVNQAFIRLSCVFHTVKIWLNSNNRNLQLKSLTKLQIVVKKSI